MTVEKCAPSFVCLFALCSLSLQYRVKIREGDHVQSNPTTSAESVWNRWRWLVRYTRSAGSVESSWWSHTWPIKWPWLFWVTGSPTNSPRIAYWHMTSHRDKPVIGIPFNTAWSDVIFSTRECDMLHESQRGHCVIRSVWRQEP
jgi:hypothetical protein